jgi:archaellum component FlaC
MNPPDQGTDLMPPQLDDLSRTLGSIEASVRELSRQATGLFERTDDSALQIRELAVQVKTLADSVTALKRDVTELRSVRDRGLGLLVGLTLVSGGVGGLAVKILGVLK